MPKRGTSHVLAAMRPCDGRPAGEPGAGRGHSSKADAGCIAYSGKFAMPVIQAALHGKRCYTGPSRGSAASLMAPRTHAYQAGPMHPCACVLDASAGVGRHIGYGFSGC
eukprot:362965-Chlamydomonas_euryale.AAC.8